MGRPRPPACGGQERNGGEYYHEQGRSRHLLHAARLLRDPGRYIDRFGRESYDIKLGDWLWHVYRMIGKLSSRICLLSAPGKD